MFAKETKPFGCIKKKKNVAPNQSKSAWNSVALLTKRETTWLKCKPDDDCSTKLNVY